MRVWSILFSLAALWSWGNGQEEVEEDDDDAGFYSSEEIKLDPSRHGTDFFKFVTRPDLDAPRWDVTTYNRSAVASGYWFVAPYGAVKQLRNNKGYVGPHIYDGDGELVWSGNDMFNKQNAFTFKVSQLGDKEVLTALHFLQHEGRVMDRTYTVKSAIPVGGPGTGGSNMHEFQLVDNGKRALFLTAQGSRSMANARLVGFEGGSCRLTAQRVEERDLNSGEITFEWSAKGQITPDESVLYENSPAELCTRVPGADYNGADYMHLNSVDKLPDGNYLISARHTDTIYMVTKDGELGWRLGGKKSDFTLADGTHWSGQHDVRCRSQNSTHLILTVFDNASRPGWPASTNPFSRGLVLSVNTEAMTAEAIMHYPHPHRERSVERGSFQTLPNGNVLLFWTNDSLSGEYTPDGALIKTARLRSGLKTYRGYKFEWDGRPTEPPVIHSQVQSVGGQLSTVVHVSWNGATRVVGWNLYETDQYNGNRSILLGEQRTGFETALVHPGYAQYVFVEAVDRLGRVLGKSRPFTTLDPVAGLSKTALAKELASLQAHPQLDTHANPYTSEDETDSRHINYRLVVVVVLCAVGAVALRNGRKFIWNWMQRRKPPLYRPLINQSEYY